jgi:hypothetical protein
VDSNAKRVSSDTKLNMAYKGPYGFSGGLNTKESSWTLPQNCLTAAQNVNIVNNDLVKRNGSVLLPSAVLNSGAAVTGLTDWFLTGTHYLIAVVGNKIYESTTLSSTFTDKTGAATITAGANNQHTFASLNNILAICGGTTPDTPLQWTGTGNVSALGGSPPIGNIVTVANNYMFIAGVAATPSRVFWSNASDPNTWSAASNVDFRPGDGDIVTNLITIGQNLLIFKNRSIGMLYTQSNTVSGAVTLAPLTQIINGIGCCGAQAADVLPDGSVIFMGYNGHVYWLQGGTSLEDISDPPPTTSTQVATSNIQPTLNTINFSQLPYCVVRTYPTKNEVWINVATGSSTTNNMTFIYNYILGVWESQFININANVACTSVDSRATPTYPIIMVTGDTSGNVYQQDTGSSDATIASPGAITGYGTISAIFGADNTDYIPLSLVVPYETQTIGTMQVGWGYDGLTNVSNTFIFSEIGTGAQLDVNFFLDVSAILSGPTTARKVVPIVGTGRSYSMQIQFYDASSTNGFTIHPVVVSDEVIV